MNKGKNYANRKPEESRPANDFYETPTCMIKELVESGLFGVGKEQQIFDPCCGKHRIGNVLRSYNYHNIIENDLMYGYDFLRDESEEQYEVIVMNPPFKDFNAFVEKAKRIADKVYCIGKMNFFGAHDRNVNKLWEHLEWVLPFDRQIAFDTPEDENGKVVCGMIVSCWMIWNKNYNGLPQIKVLDMQKYIRGKND